MNLKWLTAVMFSTLCLVGSGFAQERTPAPQGAPAAIGVAVGTRAPAFSLRDQSGRVHTNQTLRGPKGTVLLFRSLGGLVPLLQGSANGFAAGPPALRAAGPQAGDR
jgi:hypothetical protein